MSSLGDLYTHLKTLCEQWFYNKSTIDGYLNNKISKSDTVGLVKNDGSIDTNTYLTSASLSGYEQTSNKTSTWNSTTNNTRYPTEKLVKDSLDLKANSSSLSTVATSGSYTDLSNKPTIPSDVSDLTDIQNTTFTPKSHSHGNLSNDGKIGSNANYFVYTTTGGAVTSKQKIGNITTDGKVGTTANLPLITTTNGVVTTGSFGTSANSFCEGNDSRLSDARTPTAHNQGSDTITETNALSNLGTISGATQQAINNAINTAIGNLSSIDAVNIVTTLPTASSSTLGKLYIISENSKVNVYYTKENNGTYSWEKLDDDILDGLSVSWSDIKNKPSVYTPRSHAHGDISNDGAISSSAVSCTNSDYVVIATYSDDWKLKRTSAISAQMVADFTAHSNIGTSARSVQSLVNSKIDDAIGNLTTALNGKASSSHNHGNLSNDGKISTTGTSGGNIVITTSTNAVAVDTTINVIDALVQDLITYGSS